MKLLPSGWASVALGDCGTWLSGGTPRTNEPSFWGGDIPWISSGSLTEFRLYDSERRVTALGAANGTRLVKPGTVLMVVRGMSLKTEFRVGVAQREMAFGQDCKALVAGCGLNSDYLGYAIDAKSSEILGLVDEAGHGTGRLNSDQLFAVRIGVPSLPEQRAIAEVLGALDDKIAANRTVIGAADQLMGLEFSYACGHDADLCPLSDLAHFVNGKAFTKDATGTGRVVIRIAELNGGIGGSTVWNDLDVPEENVAHPGDLLFAWSGSLTVHRWFRADAIVNQHIFKVIPMDGYPLWAVNGAVRAKLAHFQRVAANKATTMGHIQRRHLDEPVLVPAGRTLARLDGLMSSLWDRALAAEMENEGLAAARDALLPLLMSGKVRVKDVEDEVGELV